jgi:protein N-terminal methyltransferase
MDHGPSNSRALDCGAGIGRITKHLLTKHFMQVDMVEQNKIFLEKARDYLKSNKRVDNLYCCGLQNFVPEAGQYDVIWCQWVLGHLTDDHLVGFFKRCT